MKTVLIGFIKGYKILISPHLPPACRFHPTCSEYAMEAIERFGIGRGLPMAIGRILRCHPFHPGGYDPVPPKEAEGRRQEAEGKRQKERVRRKESE